MRIIIDITVTVILHVVPVHFDGEITAGGGYHATECVAWSHIVAI